MSKYITVLVLVHHSLSSMLRCTSVHNIIVICVELAPNTYSLPPVRSTDTIQGALCQTVVSDEPTNTYGAALKSPRRPGAALRLYTDITV